MDKLVLFNNTVRNKLLNKRFGEFRFGQHVQVLTNICNIYEQLKCLDVTHVILGLPEDVGVYANHGNTGASKAWEATLKVLLNIQSNTFTKAKQVLILGHLDFSDELLEISNLNQNKKKDLIKSREVVERIDAYVTHLIYQIISAGKKPIIIGGGQNNAYGNIKGACLALNNPINVINLDLYSDFRPEEGRHNGNSFSYASSEGFLNKYFVFGLHEYYTSDKIFNSLDSSKTISYNTFEALEIRSELKFSKELTRASAFVSEEKFGIEIDCDAIENIKSSAMTPSGFSVNKVRCFLNYFAKQEHAIYLHICEAAPSKKKPEQVGKLITYLIMDFINV